MRLTHATNESWKSEMLMQPMKPEAKKAERLIDQLVVEMPYDLVRK
jgi:hypothetical protein